MSSIRRTENTEENPKSECQNPNEKNIILPRSLFRISDFGFRNFPLDLLAFASILGLCFLAQANVSNGQWSARPQNAEISQAESIFLDVSLRPGGVLNGSVVTRSGEAAAETEVLLKQNGQENLRTQTDQNGLFAFFGVRSGLYELWAIGEQGKGRKILRIWADGNGPPRSRPYAIVVLDPQSQQDIVRGQIGPAVFGNGPGILGSSDIHSFVLGSEIALATLIPAITNDNRPPVSP